MKNKDYISEDELNELPLPSETCPLCGARLGEDKSFCSKCGKYIGNNNKIYQVMSDEKARKIRFIVGIVAVIIAVVLFFVLKNK